MEPDDVWRAVDEQRRTLVDLLEDLSDDEWQHASLCQDWTVREVAAHLALQNTTWSAMPGLVGEVIRSGGLNGAIRAVASRHALNPTHQLIGEIRERIGVWRPLPTVTYRESAIDYLVHTQDIALPLNRRTEMPTLLAAAAADWVWERPRMFHARKRLAGYRLLATDVEWGTGRGAEMSGPISALLLLLTGRPAALDQLSGEGAATVSSRLTATTP